MVGFSALLVLSATRGKNNTVGYRSVAIRRVHLLEKRQSIAFQVIQLSATKGTHLFDLCPAKKGGYFPVKSMYFCITLL